MNIASYLPSWNVFLNHIEGLIPTHPLPWSASVTGNDHSVVDSRRRPVVTLCHDGAEASALANLANETFG